MTQHTKAGKVLTFAGQHSCSIHAPIMSKSSSECCSPCVKPFAQLLPAPPPLSVMMVFSGLNRLRISDALMRSMTLRCTCWA